MLGLTMAYKMEHVGLITLTKTDLYMSTNKIVIKHLHFSIASTAV